GRGLSAAARGGGLSAGVRVGVRAALAGFIVAGLFEWNFGDEELLYPLYFLTGLAWAAAGWEADPKRSPSRAAGHARRLALVHDWLTGMRGGEKALERLCRLFPEADVYTLVWNRGSVSPAIERHAIVTSFLQRLPAP